MFQALVRSLHINLLPMTFGSHKHRENEFLCVLCDGFNVATHFM